MTAGRPPIGDRTMTNAERQRRWRCKRRQANALEERMTLDDFKYACFRAVRSTGRSDVGLRWHVTKREWIAACQKNDVEGLIALAGRNHARFLAYAREYQRARSTNCNET
jgi:hypothetical protein